MIILKVACASENSQTVNTANMIKALLYVAKEEFEKFTDFQKRKFARDHFPQTPLLKENRVNVENSTTNVDPPLRQTSFSENRLTF